MCKYVKRLALCTMCLRCHTQKHEGMQQRRAVNAELRSTKEALMHKGGTHAQRRHSCTEEALMHTQKCVIQRIRIIRCTVFNVYLTVLNVSNDRMTHPCAHL